MLKTKSSQQRSSHDKYITFLVAKIVVSKCRREFELTATINL